MASTGSDSAPNPETVEIIHCLKAALAKSIASISLPEKDRPLDPHKDFTISSAIRFEKPRQRQRANSAGGDAVVASSSGGGGGCCSASSARVKRNRPIQMSAAVSSDEENEFDDGVGVDRRDAVDGDDDSDDDRDQKATSPCNASFTFTDYSPMCYRHIREFFSVDAKSYRQVLVQSTWHSVPTPGKSAAQLFFCGQNWVIKTMTEQESNYLRRILHKYYYHVRDNPHTLLPHFVGHHLIEIHGKKMIFVIMQNVFATANKIHEKFDLKGSTIGRFATREEKMKQTCTQKDLDINRPIVVGSQRRTLLMQQMKKDCDFLKRAMIMDYSLLIGIHVVSSAPPATSKRGEDNNVTTPLLEPLSGGVPPGNPSSVAEESMFDGRCFTADQGGMLSSCEVNGRQEIYYIGIIDILQEYTLWKRSETVVQGFLSDRKRISSVHPTDYAARFYSFMSALLV